MGKSILSLCVAVLSVLLVCSCHDEDEVAVSTDCYISSFTLGNVKREIHSVTTAGKDTTYTTSYSGSYYPMVIDQVNGTISNRDSLPVNSLVNAVLASVSASGSVTYRRTDEDESAWKTYSSSDSIDFTSPLVFRVYSADYSMSRDYVVKVNVHQQDGDTFVWDKVTETAPWAAADSVKVWIRDGRIWSFCKEEGRTRLFTAGLSGDMDWAELPLSGCENADVTTLTGLGGQMYMSDTEGGLWQSDDMQNWRIVAADRPVRLAAADGTGLYALSEGRMFRSTDGTVWTEERLDEDLSFLPSRDLSSVAYAQDNGVSRVLLVGNRDMGLYPSDEAAMVWSRSGVAGAADAGWSYFNVSPENRYACPRLSSLHIVRYDDVLLAMGRGSLDGTTHQALDSIYVSHDNGITWKTDDVYVLPEEVRGTDAAMSAAVDSDFYVWLVAGIQVWRGRLTELGFAEY